MADDHHRLAVEAGHAGNDGLVVGIGTITVQFFEIGKDGVDVVLGIGALRMARQLRDLPGIEVGEDGLGQALALGLQTRDLFADVDLGIVADVAQLLDLGLKLGDRLLNSRNSDS